MRINLAFVSALAFMAINTASHEFVPGRFDNLTVQPDRIERILQRNVPVIPPSVTNAQLESLRQRMFGPQQVDGLIGPARSG